MRTARRHLDNSRLSHPGGGKIHCGACDSIVAKIEMYNYRYIKFFYVCKCGNTGKVELFRGDKPWLEYPKRPLYNIGNRFLCQACETLLFYVEKENVNNFAFDVICKCGIEYDLIFENKRGSKRMDLLGIGQRGIK